MNNMNAAEALAYLSDLDDSDPIAVAAVAVLQTTYDQLRAMRAYDMEYIPSGCECCGGNTERNYCSNGDHVEALLLQQILRAEYMV